MSAVTGPAASEWDDGWKMELFTPFLLPKSKCRSLHLKSFFQEVPAQLESSSSVRFPFFSQLTHY